jgi:hypothetical protein
MKVRKLDVNSRGDLSRERHAEIRKELETRREAGQTV